MSQKRYFWLKLRDNFFNTKEIKLIRKLPSGSDILIVLLKLQVAALKTGGLIEIDGICESVEEEISLIIDEDINVVKISLVVLKKFHLISTTKESDIEVLLHDESIFSETASTIRSRKSRNAKKLQNLEPKKLDKPMVSDIEVLQCNTNATGVQQKCNAEIETNLEKEKEKEKNKLTNKKDDLKDQSVSDSFSFFVDENKTKDISLSQPFGFIEASEEDKKEGIQEDLHGLGLTSAQIKSVLRVHPTAVIDQAIIETHQAQIDQRINDKASQYFYGVLRNISTAKKLA